VYLAVRESGRPKRKKTKNWIETTRKTLDPYKVFVLCDSRTKELYPNQWREFVNVVNSNQKQKKERVYGRYHQRSWVQIPSSAHRGQP